jgi:hypothetical protein
MDLEVLTDEELTRHIARLILLLARRSGEPPRQLVDGFWKGLPTDEAWTRRELLLVPEELI